MMKHVHVKWNPGLTWQKQYTTRRRIFSPANWTFKEKLVNCYIWSVTLYGAEMRTLRQVDQKYMECVEVSTRRRLQKISSIDSVKNAGVLHGTKAKRNISPTVTSINANWTGFDSPPVLAGFVVNKFSPSTTVFLFRCHFTNTPYYFIYRAPR